MPRFAFLAGDGIDRLPVFGLAYLRHVVAEYRICEQAQTAEPPAVTSLLSKFESTPNDMTWSELFLLEKYILGRQSFPALRRRAWILRSKYKEIAGASEYDAYEKSNPPNENAVCPEGQEKQKEEELRSDLDRVLSAVHWNYSLAPIRERFRGHIVKTTSLLLGAWLIIVGLFSSWCFLYDQVLIGTLLLVMFAGATGGFVSLQRRLQSIPTDGDPLYSIFQLENGLTSVYLSPLSGAIFAVVLFLIFLANLVGGMIFPKVVGFDFHLGAVGWKAIPPTEPAVEYAKLMVWSFIAGFAERFVPDALDRLVNRGKDAMAAPAAAPVVVTGTGDGTANGGTASKIKGLNLPGKGDLSGTGKGANGNAEDPLKPEDANGKP